MKIIATNKKAFSDYIILETYEAGIELRGTEVKSLRESGANFKDSFCRIKNGEVFLLNLNIPQYRNGSLNNHDPERPRRLLLHKKEIHRLLGKVKEQGLTIIPTKIYFNNRGLVKVEIAVAKGKKKYDKREDIKKREINRRIREYLKG
ncbi:single-stranded DNA-binding protein [Thermosipho melanesiensis]|uniref:SsrA-binding protein n=2 Tax=Thermosipho melanesiensis TaxID=46541 RepID=SSRP_THEM4|nr:SsrA-binding protein SmpB [Thermosipho melanesiensis]A6LJL7.1 RecName: Full=SsrA-binding protein; AltName: Full=Small protein B [Thermosipho melanesiensis BI429]ABR30118.1 SsrA-binding protein [Thermosipho melanesiensis BI429]APT73315.1 single-stranded DNA-binding protein [Thermosipho melanesiensis]OOC38706.1 single-stranded DNA-binding protein [Thermosipho melanesiensis]OOC40510.1 single-stranded DNA-binding protein [Thermosipho melanesiensis]OOC40775.1 single-stranded DNA-binding protein